MKTLFRRYLTFLLCIFILSGTGCGLLNKLGQSFVTGASVKTDSLGINLVAGLRKGLADPKTKTEVSYLLDSILTALDTSLQPKVKGLRDTIINHKVILWADTLVETLTGNKLKLNVEAVQEAFMGKTKKDLFQMEDSVKVLFDELLSDSTNSKLGKMRDELLGAKTDTAISLIVDNATKKFIERYKSDLDPALKGDVSFISRYATALLLTLGGIAIVIILIIWWSKRRYLQLVTLLTKHINNIPDQKVYDQVTSKIQDEAITTGLEPDLRKILNANGLLNDKDWKSKGDA